MNTIKNKNARRLMAALIGACTIGLAPGSASAADYHQFTWQKVADGVWFGTTPPDTFQTGNVTIIALPTGGSMVVDTQDSDFFGREILQKAQEVSPGPVRYVVNTHAHQDHAGGNVAFRDAYPQVQIIAHRNTCIDIVRKTEPRMLDRLPGLRQGVQDMKTRLAALPAGDKAAAGLERRITGTELYLKDTENFRWVLPTQCLDLKPGQSDTIVDGDRRIDIDYFGQAHSTGDLVVFLPKEKLIVMADLWTQNTGSALVDSGMDGRDGSVLLYPSTLKAVRALDFDTALTGHANVMHGKASLDAAIGFSLDMNARIRERTDRGDMVEEVLQKLPPPADATPVVATRWRRTVISGFEEIEIRRKLGIALPGDPPATAP